MQQKSPPSVERAGADVGVWIVMSSRPSYLPPEGGRRQEPRRGARRQSPSPRRGRAGHRSPTIPNHHGASSFHATPPNPRAPHRAPRHRRRRGAVTGAVGVGGTSGGGRRPRPSRAAPGSSGRPFQHHCPPRRWKSRLRRRRRRPKSRRRRHRRRRRRRRPRCRGRSHTCGGGGMRGDEKERTRNQEHKSTRGKEANVSQSTRRAGASRATLTGPMCVRERRYTQSVTTGRRQPQRFFSV
jgi:hypothetical protein